MRNSAPTRDQPCDNDAGASHAAAMHILVAEDDRDIAELISHYLKKAGWTTHVGRGRRPGARLHPKPSGGRRHSRPDAAGNERPRRLQGAARRRGDGRRADHHADGARRGGRPHTRSRAWRRRLRRQAVQPQRARGAGARRVAPIAAQRDRRSASCGSVRSRSISRSTSSRSTDARSSSPPRSSCCSSISSSTADA